MQKLPAKSIHPVSIAYLQDRVLMRRGEAPIRRRVVGEQIRA
jgi:hypothetical protein